MISNGLLPGLLFFSVSSPAAEMVAAPAVGGFDGTIGELRQAANGRGCSVADL
jgi:hypothetical protein